MLAQGNVEACLAKQYVRFVNRREVGASTVDGCDAKELARVATDEGLVAHVPSSRGVAEFLSTEGWSTVKAAKEVLWSCPGACFCAA